MLYFLFRCQKWSGLRIVLFLFVLTFSEQAIGISESDSLKKHAYPADTIAGQIFVRKPGFRKFLDYFINANQPNPNKKFDFSVIGGPNYSSDTKFGIGLLAAGLYRMDRSDTLLPPSDVSLYGNVSTSGFYLIGIRGNNLFPKDSYRLLYNLFFYSLPSYYWGIGYTDGANKENKSRYKRFQILTKADFLCRVAPYTYLGPSIELNWAKGYDFEKPELLYGEDQNVISPGLGFTFVYDSRDFIPNAYKGLFVKAEQRFFASFLGNMYAFTRSSLTIDFYQKLWKGSVLAFDFYSQLNYGRVPWSMLATVGGSFRMRSYFEGQYRDRDIVSAQIELRQKIWRRNGIAIWGGAGNVFHSFKSFRTDQILPTYGIGYRWEFKKRVNIRLDYGIGKGQSSFLFNINEAF